jgi:hypothetical protein
VRQLNFCCNARIGEMKTIRGTSDTIYVKLKCENSQCFSIEVVCKVLILIYLLIICKMQKSWRVIRYPLLVIGFGGLPSFNQAPI